uniref:Outer capsid protein VP4 n=1 Tax=Rotavirus B (isolate RVB/Rat/United States/IDIR/1984/G1P[X]) TaxID=28877 RepID=VP4_ROTGI|nr:RecName: Full=Outer capsid protein VP4; AltName: Full=Hemagglutinin; Contains: RecName: Full=Outer capsid protein VP8*; Contains: RecName: Full=Outer capsid protein VP5* [IDIR agent]CAA34823.1 hypothetical protein [IDIR agent]
MLAYLRREWQSYGETVIAEGTFNSTSSDSSQSEKPIKTDGRYCYQAEIGRNAYSMDARGFMLGESDRHVDTTQFLPYTGYITDGIKYCNIEPPCGTLLRMHFDVSGDVSVDMHRVASIYVEVDSVTYDGSQYTIRGYRDRNLTATETQKKLIFYGFRKLGMIGMTGNGRVMLTSTIIQKISYKHQFTFQMHSESYVWGPCSGRIKTRVQGNDSRIIIYEQEDGFWKILKETLWIKLKPYFKPYGTMGGAFKNWLIDSGFEKHEYTYSYERDGQVVNATTVTYVKPTGKAGINQSWRPATDYNGQFTVLQPEDEFSVWYFEDKWQISQAIYAKNFQSDSQVEGELTNNGALIFKMNYIPSLAGITNKGGKVKYRYISGGFAQIDTSRHTGLAIILNFKCYGKKFYADNNNYPVDNALNPYICYIGDSYTLSGGTHYRQGACAGFAAGYDDEITEHDMTISYTVMKPSDPDFVTGGDNYGQTVTSDIERSIRDLQDQINSILAEMNIQQVTSAVFTAITNLGELPSLFSNITKVFNRAKDNIKKLRSRSNSDISPIGATKIIDKTTLETPQLSVINRMPEEYELGIIYNSMRTRKLIDERKHDFDTFAVATEMELPYISKVNTLTKEFKDYLKKPGLLSNDDVAVQIDPMNNRLSVLRRKYADIIEYKIDPELAHEVLSNMSNSATRSLFSLNVRKQIAMNNSFSEPTFSQIIDRMFDDGQLIDVLNNLNRETATELFDEFLTRIKSMLVKMS